MLLDPVHTEATLLTVNRSNVFPYSSQAEIRDQDNRDDTVVTGIALSRPRHSRFVDVNDKIPIAYPRTSTREAIPDKHLADWPAALGFIGIAVFCLWIARS